MEEYRARIADQMLAELLEVTGGVLVQGPKWCGKTTTAAQAARSKLYMDDPDTREQNLALADTNIRQLLAGETPRLIDEWEMAPKLWDAARFEIDHHAPHVGRFIFTGSSVPKERDQKQITHSGAGRFSMLKMRTMSLWESGDSSGEVSLKDLFEGGKANATQGKKNLTDIAYLICRGGWPGALRLKNKAALKIAQSYLQIVANTDINAIDDKKRDSEFMMRIIRSLARHQGGQVPISTLYTDLSSNAQRSMSEDTIDNYINVLKGIFLEEDMRAWNPNLRSRTAIRTSDTRYFTDPSIATAALGIGPDDLMNNLETFGLIFETLAVRDLRVYADAIDGEVFHYRDKNKLECDAVVHLQNSHYGLIEIKLGGDRLIEAGASTLKTLASKIDTQRMNEPSFLMVLTAIGQYAYQRPDGVLVVPITVLKN